MKNDMKNDAINTFIFDVVLVDPIADILKKLENNEFRDCDILWLENKMRNFLDFAAKTLGLQVPVIMPSEDIGVVMNDCKKQRFIKSFKALLDYFKSFQ